MTETQNTLNPNPRPQKPYIRNCEVGFWLLLAGAVVFGCSTVLATLACRQCRKKAASPDPSNPP